MTYSELISKSQQKGYSVRANINPGYVAAIKEWAKENGIAVANAIKAGDTKTAIQKLIYAQKLKHSMKQQLNELDSIVYDKNGKSIYWYEVKTKLLYRIA